MEVSPCGSSFICLSSATPVAFFIYTKEPLGSPKDSNIALSLRHFRFPRVDKFLSQIPSSSTIMKVNLIFFPLNMDRIVTCMEAIECGRSSSVWCLTLGHDSQCILNFMSLGSQFWTPGCMSSNNPEIPIMRRPNIATPVQAAPFKLSDEASNYQPASFYSSPAQANIWLTYMIEPKKCEPFPKFWPPKLWTK